MPTSTREIHLAARPIGAAKPSDFRMVDAQLADPGEGEVLVRTIAMSVDPYMRGRMNAEKSYAPPWELNEAALGSAIGEVIASEVEDLPVGTLVRHGHGWREHALLHASAVTVVEPVPGVPLTVHLGALGGIGLTAWAGLVDVASLEEGDRVFVSGAAGAVGSLVGQFAKLRRAGQVIGSAGSPEKVQWLTDELGFDDAFNYHDGPVRKLLAAAAPHGIDVFFDNVGYDHLEAAIDASNTFARFALCGSIAGYDMAQKPPAPDNLSLIVGRRLTVKGFIVGDHSDRQGDFLAEVGGWLRDGKLVIRETVVEGLDNAVDAFLGLLKGANTGKMIVRLAPDPA
jgi:NADPH-dependent curcumin reductase CurA